MIPPGTPVLSQSLQLSPSVPSLFDVCLQIETPRVSRPSTFASLRCVPGYDLSCTAVDWLAESVANDLQRFCRISCSGGTWHARCHNRSLPMI